MARDAGVNIYRVDPFLFLKLGGKETYTSEWFYQNIRDVPSEARSDQMSKVLYDTGAIETANQLTLKLNEVVFEKKLLSSTRSEEGIRKATYTFLPIDSRLPRGRFGVELVKVPSKWRS